MDKFDRVSLRSALRAMFNEIDMTYAVRDELLQITSIEQADENPLARIYFIEGLGFHHQDIDSISYLIYCSVAPDTWSVGGGDIARLNSIHYDRPAIVVSTTYDKHEQIANLFQALRQTQAGPDPE